MASLESCGESRDEEGQGGKEEGREEEEEGEACWKGREELILLLAPPAPATASAPCCEVIYKST